MRNVSAFQPTQYNSLLNGLVSYYKLDESSGNATDNISGNTGVNTSTTYSTGKINNGGVFNGTTSKLVITESTSLQFSPAVSISAWFKTSSTAIAIIMSKDSQALGGYLGYGLYMNITTGNIRMRVRTATGAVFSDLDTTGKSYNDNAWHHVVATYNAGTQVIYVDGVSVATGGSGSVIHWATPQAMRIGASSVDDNFFNGSIDEVGVWNRALTATEVATLYYNGNNGSQINLLSQSTKAYYPLNGNSTDFSGNTNTGTDTAITYPQGRFGQGAKFNGSSSVISSSGTFPSGALPVTVSCWAKPSITTGNMFVFAYGNDASGQMIGCSSLSTGNYVFTSYTGDDNSGIPLNISKWVNITMVDTGSTQYGYIDGILKTTRVRTLNKGSGNFKIGSYLTSGSYWNGIIDEVIIESRAWTAKEVETYYRKSTLNYRQKSMAQMLLSILALDTITTSETFTSIRSRLSSTVDTITTSETVSAVKALLLTVLDTVTTSETVTNLRSRLSSVVDTIMTSEPVVSVRKKWDNIVKNVASWTNGSKNTSTWTSTDKNDSTWTNLPKN